MQIDHDALRRQEPTVQKGLTHVALDVDAMLRQRDRAMGIFDLAPMAGLSVQDGVLLVASVRQGVMAECPGAATHLLLELPTAGAAHLAVGLIDFLVAGIEGDGKTLAEAVECGVRGIMRSTKIHGSMQAAPCTELGRQAIVRIVADLLADRGLAPDGDSQVAAP